MANELVLRITTDSRGNRLSLDSISIEAAEVLTVFLGSLSDLANAQDSTEDMRISLRNSSVGVALEFPETETQINTGIDDVLEGRSLNNQYYKTLKIIQDRVKANGLSYEVEYKVDNVTKNLTEDFKARDFIRRVGTRKERTEKVVFLQGEIYQAGGKKNPNLHMTVDGQDITVGCTQEQAQRLDKVLYNEIFICALKTSKDGEDASYLLLDSYATVNTFKMFKNFYEGMNHESIDRFDVIVGRLIEAINSPRIPGEVVKILRLFDYPQADRGNLRTILVALKPVRQLEAIAALYTKLAEHLRAGSTNKVI